ncbi:hypothetical protein K6V18_20335 [Ralstonia insidiosa]|uniref:hypothetical protein n=1 Tax=Ralstonia TaxID=48736 RepID=UPI0012ED9685|nr:MULTISPECIES: hypothetical protein [Ralstonia]MBY4707380.1 hypothetical protein [Ralstonia insidiosa]
MPEDWEASRRELSNMIGTRFNGVPISYSNAINPTGGFIDDLSRVFQQKLAENPSLSWELLVRASLGLIEGLSPELAKFILDLIVKTENESTAELKKKWEAENSYIDGRVTTHVTDYTRDILDNGRRVLLVAHSQGNLYANASHRLLYTNPEVTPGSFGTIGVASPANYVAGGGEYITSDADVIINALRSIISDQVLPANVSIPFDTAELSGHNFIKTYMHIEKPAREKIRQITISGLNKLVEPKEAYDYKIVSHIFSGPFTPNTGEITGNFDLDRNVQYNDLSGCPIGVLLCAHPPEIKNIYDSTGKGYDRQIAAERDTSTKLSVEAIKKLAASDKNAEDPAHPLNWHLNARLPLLYLNFTTELRENNGNYYTHYVWGTSSYDSSGKINTPTQQASNLVTLVANQFLMPVFPTPPWTADNPITPPVVFNNQVWNPLISSLDSLRHRAVEYEVAKLESEKFVFATLPDLVPFSNYYRVTRLTTKICKSE